MGNIHSVRKALEHLGAKTAVVYKPAGAMKFSRLVLPGVGAFDDAMAALKKNKLAAAICDYISTGKPFLGICLGMQLLFESSREARKEKGFGLLKGSVELFAKKKGLKVPHMGWNQLKQAAEPCPLLKEIKNNSYVYFCHSYYAAPEDKRIIAATADYGADFAAVVCRDNIYGVQFHPEKSQGTGLQILRNFIEL